MRRLVLFLVLTSCLSFLSMGCAKSGDSASADGLPSNSADPALADTPAPRPSIGDESQAGAESKAGAESPSAVAAEQIELTPANTRIQFVGNHTGDDPNPRTGHFEEFSGQLGWDPVSGTLQSVSVDIETASLTTDITRLTNHLRSNDFFGVDDHPHAGFVSTNIEPQGEGEFLVTGEMTLIGNTRPIQFPVRMDASSEELKLTSEFSILRSEFGMTYGPDQVEDEIFVTVTVNGGVE